jgi:hypothetical protein
MKTKDSISKKRQKIYQEIAFWEARERDSRAGLALTEAAQATREKVVNFCRQEIAKRRKDARALERGTKAQRLAGWR